MSSGFMFHAWSVPKIILRPGGDVEWAKTTRPPSKKEVELARARMAALEKAVCVGSLIRFAETCRTSM